MEKIDLGKDKLIGSLAILKANIVEGKTSFLLIFL